MDIGNKSQKFFRKNGQLTKTRDVAVDKEEVAARKEKELLSSSLQVVSVNIEGNLHLDRVIPFLKKQNADIICLQEVFFENLIRFEQELSKQSYFCVTGKITKSGGFRFDNLGNWGIAILTHLPVVYKTHEYYSGHHKYIRELIPSQDLQCRALQIFKVVHGSMTFTIANTHFTWSHDGKPNAKQWQDLRKMLNILKNWKELVLLGDFNACRGEAVFSELSRHYQDNIPKEVSSTIDGTLHRAGELNIVVDGIFTTPGNQAVDVKIHHGVSDHCAITAKIKQL